MLRLYYNRRGDRPCSVDDGDQRSEKTFKCVSIAARGLTSYKVIPGADREQVPVFCIEFPKGRLFAESGGDFAIITE